MSPIVFIAIALITGIVVASLTKLALTMLIITFAAVSLGSLTVSIRGSSRYGNIPVFLVFALLGALLMTISETAAVRNVSDSKSHQNPVYRRISKQAKQSLSGEQSGLLLAIVYGDKKGVSDNNEDDFKQSGLFHLFAASGFNVTLAAGFVMLISRIAKAPKLLSASLALASIVFYLWLVGQSPSVLRATVMSIILYLSVFFGRKVDALASTSTAAVILLLIDPTTLFNIGWQLSFAGLLGILVISPKISELIKPEIRRIAAPLIVTTGAQLAVAPFLFYYFGQISTVAIIANPIVAMAVAYITGIGFCAGFVSLFWPAIGRLIFASLAPVLSFVSGSSSVFANLPAATIHIRPSLINILIFLSGLIIISTIFFRRKKKFSLISIVIFILVVQTAGLWLDLSFGVQRQGLVASFLNIGQGDATLIKSRKGITVLIDGGREYPALNSELRQRGVRRIDFLILSHAHADHIGALVKLVQRYPVGRIIEPGYKYQTRGYLEFKHVVREQNIPIIKGHAGQVFKLGDIEIDILWPKSLLLSGTESDINNNSIVAKVRFKDISFLFPGDIQTEAISDILNNSIDIKADILKVSHQGSSNGTTTAFLRRIRAKYAVVFVGKPNPYGHPHKQTMKRLKRFVKNIRRTDLRGDITIMTDGAQISLASER